MSCWRGGVVGQWRGGAVARWRGDFAHLDVGVIDGKHGLETPRVPFIGPIFLVIGMRLRTHMGVQC